MTEMRVGDQTILYDAEATAAVYARLGRGWADNCGCAGCRNVIAQREEIYPVAFQELLRRLGVDCKKESEVVADGLQDKGLHHYGGWFFFVGRMVTTGENVVVLSESPYFCYFFTRVGPRPNEFRDVPSIAVAFEAHFKWVLTESWDSDLH